MKAKRLSKARRVDLISTLPQTIIETILCLLPIEEAARTSILSREWRYKWTTIPKLVFYESSVKISIKEIPLNKPSNMKQLDWQKQSELQYKREEKELRSKLFRVIHQVMLLRQGPILEFFLSMAAHHNYFEIDQIILHLSRNHTVKKLTFDFCESSSYSLPLSFFSALHHLTDLSLEYCDIYGKPIFNGSDTLTSLSLSRLSICGKTLLHLLSNCPSLKSLSLFLLDEQFDGTRPHIMELFKSLPMIEHLTTWGYITPLFDLNSVPQELQSTLSHLKYFCFKEIGLSECYRCTFGLTFLAVLLRCSPNLEKIKLEIDTDPFFDDESDEESEDHSDIFEEYSDVWLEHLNELKIEDFFNDKRGLEFVKFILARSPNLKKVILLTYIDDKNEEVELLQILLRAPRASPVLILVENGCKTRRNPC